MPEDKDMGEVVYERQSPIWMRGLYMIVFAIFFAIAETVLGVLALVQFFWMLFAGERNQAIADFGQSLGLWIRRVVEFQTGASEEKPFPWAPWNG